MGDVATPEALETPISRVVSAEDWVKIKNRISRAQGQVAGIIRMFEADVPIPEIAVQMRASFYAVRRTAVRLLILGVEEQAVSPEGDMADVFAGSFPLMRGMFSGNLIDLEKGRENLKTAQHALSGAQVVLEEDDSFLKLLAILSVAAGFIREVSVSLFLEKLMEARRAGDVAECEVYEKLIMTY
ncbi:MAG: metal-sensing transcriptional repressor [Ancrocorticia sp.]